MSLGRRTLLTRASTAAIGVLAAPAILHWPAYAAFGEPDPLAAIRGVVRGYTEIFPLTDDESRALFPLILARLAVSVTNSAYLKSVDPASAYVTVSESQAWALLEKYTGGLA